MDPTQAPNDDYWVEARMKTSRTVAANWAFHAIAIENLPREKYAESFSGTLLLL